ncbi:EmrB/QacA subfamily drug resistance transporter [Halopolyspora algeriensis]|uniref:EmrB/QacA subfamily drug resistance transporter n=1 Tax=Halopolyspora algeriensis TaxID=1500506 RepID=A0A368VI27_9ACTN|nr:MFS transporter [Halopolyspora algeriensis]RCW40834.1 EmrB/QacA subfamily drug resistance transporter [Halopolyspora algeriensis]TQM53248.1 EmrB/QacA subfamily drug resistance transporter [Halopolyspora algeriensis]
MTASGSDPQDSEPVRTRLGEPSGRWVLAATVLGSGMAALDATVVTIALPVLGRELNAGLVGLQWVVNGYTLTLAALILLGGSLGDRYGRKRLFLVGTGWFALASLGCALAPTIEALIAARALQGIGGALLTPGSLAIIQASFVPEHRSRAIGAWSGLAGIASAVGPFLGGWLVAAGNWRWIFLLNLPLAALVVAVTARHVPESSAPSASRRPDVAGAALCTLGLAGLTYALSVAGESGITPVTMGVGLGGLAGLTAFVLVEHVKSEPMLPLGIFASRRFSAVNLVTLTVYAALGGVFFLLVLHLQVVAGFSPLLAGAALLPVTAIMLALSARMGALAQRIGPRLPMTVGPVVAAAGLLLMLRIGSGASYSGEVLPAVALFGFGLAITVAPLTSTALAAAGPRHTGIASGVNNAVARTAQMLAVAVLPVAVGLSGDDYTRPALFAAGFDTAMLICAGLLVLGGALSALSIPNSIPDTAGSASGTARSARGKTARRSHCAVDGPPLDSGNTASGSDGNR